MKTLVIGDIHGCFDELQDLLVKADITGDDRIIALGDIVDRGLQTPEVLNFFHGAPNRLSLMGNHERKHVRGARHEVRLALSQIISRQQFGDAYSASLAQMAAFPTYLELPEAILVHGYLEPEIPLEQQLDTVLCGTMGGDGHLRSRYSRPWYELYSGEKPVIVGHHDHLRSGQPFIFQGRIYCLDTSCVHGRALTGLILPDFTIVSVPSRRDYWSEVRRVYSHLGKPSRPAVIRPLLPEGWDNESEQKLGKILAFAQAESERVMNELQAQPGYCDWTPREQAKAYAEVVGHSMPWSALLHAARKGKIDPDAARRLFKHANEVQWLLANLTG